MPFSGLWHSNAVQHGSLGLPPISRLGTIAGVNDATGDKGLRRRTAFAKAVAARELHEHVAKLIPLVGSANIGALLEGTRQLRALDQRYRTMLILYARIVEGATWAYIATKLKIDLDTAIALYEGIELRWIAGDPAPWTAVGKKTTSVTAPPIDVAALALPDAAADLDNYVQRYTDWTPSVAGERPVTDGLP